jgi:universal stress protein E
MRAKGLQVSVDVAWDRPLYKALLRKIERSKPWIVFKDTHYHPAISRAIFSNTDWNLIRGSSAPLWLVKPHADSAIRSVLAAVDPLHERDKPAGLDNRILATARALGGALNGDVHVFHAFDVAAAIAVTTDAMSMPIALPLNDLADAMRAEHTEAVARLCQQHGVPPERTHVQQGGTRQLLLTLTEKLRADAVVMGAVSRSGLKGLFLGNTAEDVLDRLHCDLVIVKPAGFKAVLAS